MTAEQLAAHIVETPCVEWVGQSLAAELPAGVRVDAKLELLQRSGTFKFRSALAHVLQMTPDQRRHGVTAMSAGNHAIAVACAARIAGIHAKVVMQSSANPARVSMARAYGAEILMAPDGETGFAMIEDISRAEKRTIIPPFEGRTTALGTATLGLELMRQAPDLDAVFIAIGGGGLAGGVASIIKLISPACRIIGVEPENAAVMTRSIASGRADNDRCGEYHSRQPRAAHDPSICIFPLQGLRRRDRACQRRRVAACDADNLR